MRSQGRVERVAVHRGAIRRLSGETDKRDDGARGDHAAERARITYGVNHGRPHALPESDALLTRRQRRHLKPCASHRLEVGRRAHPPPTRRQHGGERREGSGRRSGRDHPQCRLGRACRPAKRHRRRLRHCRLLRRGPSAAAAAASAAREGERPPRRGRCLLHDWRWCLLLGKRLLGLLHTGPRARVVELHAADCVASVEGQPPAELTKVPRQLGLD
mmetsp:Transcript_30943/g.99341  ORF Transcript_30943/g.99341 Transcript_30943/m.99341 type:complete len:217 (-) Transcript_30943:630-1280(-)